MHHPLSTITYVSTATVNYTPQRLEALLAHSRDANKKRGITGLLLFADGRFMQVFEGPERNVAGLYERILADPTHHSVIKLFDEPIFERAFPQWSMGFRDVDRLIDGHSTFMDEDSEAAAFFESDNHAKALLASFRKALQPII